MPNYSTTSSLDQTIAASGENPTVASGEFTPWQQPEPLTVVISTAYATGVSSSLASAQNVEQISASLAYGISEDEGIGFEVGATSYSIDQASNVLSTTEPVSAMMRSSVNEEPDDGKLSTPETGPGAYTSSSQRQTAQVRTAWGGAFYERRLLSLEDVSVHGRAGAGLLEDGVLGYGRVSGQWMLGAGISVMVGAEARSMPFQTGAGAAVSSEITYGAVITAVTGIQVRF